MIGDTLRDVGAGHSAGCWTILLSGGDSRKQSGILTAPPDFIFNGLQNAVDFILDSFDVLFSEAVNVSEKFMASGKETLVISGMARSGKSTFATILRQVLSDKGYEIGIFSSDTLLKSSQGQIARKIDETLAKEVMSTLFNKQLMSSLSTTIRIHETGEDFICNPIDISNSKYIIIEGEDLPYLDDANIFHIRVNTRENARFSRFKSKYSLRGLSDKDIGALF